MRYIMFVATDPDAEPYVEAEDNIGEWVDEMTDRGVEIMGERLRPAEDARTVTRRAGEVIVTEGPFTASREQIVGFDILECASIDEAVEVAAKHPMSRFGRIEVRAFWPLDL